MGLRDCPRSPPISHVHDLHATILTLLGLDHEALMYFFQGRDFRLSDVGRQNNLATKLTT